MNYNNVKQLKYVTHIENSTTMILDKKKYFF